MIPLRNLNIIFIYITSKFYHYVISLRFSCIFTRVLFLHQLIRKAFEHNYNNTFLNAFHLLSDFITYHSLRILISPRFVLFYSHTPPLQPPFLFNAIFFTSFACIYFCKSGWEMWMIGINMEISTNSFTVLLSIFMISKHIFPYLPPQPLRNKEYNIDNQNHLLLTFDFYLICSWEEWIKSTNYLIRMFFFWKIKVEWSEFTPTNMSLFKFAGWNL